MELVLNSFLLVAATEMGDKTQLLAFMLASRFQRPGVVLAGILAATIFNHGLAAFFGNWVAIHVSATIIKWVLSAGFLFFAIWVLVPDKDEEIKNQNRYGAFLTTFILFFLAEMGDKTQLATVALAARYSNIGLVTLGTTLGMLFSDGLAVMFGRKINEKISMKWVRYFSAFLFLIMAIGVWLPELF